MPGGSKYSDLVWLSVLPSTVAQPPKPPAVKRAPRAPAVATVKVEQPRAVPSTVSRGHESHALADHGPQARPPAVVRPPWRQPSAYCNVMVCVLRPPQPHYYHHAPAPVGYPPMPRPMMSMYGEGGYGMPAAPSPAYRMMSYQQCFDTAPYELPSTGGGYGMGAANSMSSASLPGFHLGASRMGPYPGHMSEASSEFLPTYVAFGSPPSSAPPQVGL